MNDTTSTAVIDQPAAGLSRELLDECRQLAFSVAPELAHDPFYILNAPAGYPRRKGVIAVAVHGLDFHVRKALCESGDWIGPGRQVIFFDHQLDRNAALGTTLHEVAHAITMGVPPADHDPTPEQFERQTIRVAELLGSPIAESPSMPNWFPAHGSIFLRIALHLHYRAWAAGFEVGLPSMRIAGEIYSLSPAWRYLHAIGDEPARRIGEKIETILATSPPEEFIALFRDDVAEWSKNKSLHHQTKEVPQ